MEQLLEQRLFWLRKFLHCATSFLHYLNETISSEELALFQQNRSRLLRIIEKIDCKINTIDPSSRIAVKEKILFYEQEKESILKGVVEADQKILLYLERLAREDAQKLKALNKSRSVLSRYHSQEREKDRLDAVL